MVVTKLEQWHASANTGMKHKSKYEPAGPVALAGCSAPPAKCSAPQSLPEPYSTINPQYPLGLRLHVQKWHVQKWRFPASITRPTFNSL